MSFVLNHQRVTTIRRARLRTTEVVLLVALSVTSIVFRGANASPGVAPVRDQSAKPRPYSRHASKEALKWADKQLKGMSLEEKVGQLISVGINATYLNQDSDAFQTLRHQVVDNHVGGIILFRGPVYESVVIVNRMQRLAKHPLLISADLEA